MAIQSINEPQTPAFDAVVGAVKPSITSLNPASVEVGGPDVRLYVTGEGFGPDTVIYFAGFDEPTTLEDDGTVSTGLKPSLWVDPVTVQVYVRNGTLHSDPVDFEFAAPAARKSKRVVEEDDRKHTHHRR